MTKQALILQRNLLICKNYLISNFSNFLKHLLFFAVICYFLIEEVNDCFNGEKWSLTSLFFIFLIFLISIRQRPFSFQQSADLYHCADVFDYLKKMMIQNLICWPLILTLIIGIPVYFTYKHNLFDFILVIHAALVSWFTANFIVSLYKIKRVFPVNPLFSRIIIITYLTFMVSEHYIDYYLFPDSPDFMAFKFIPLAGWLLELFSGDTTYIYQMYFGFIFASLSVAFILYQRIKTNYSPSLIRERLFELAAEQNKSKEKRSLASRLKIPPLKIKSNFKFAPALHYKNLCLNKQLGWLAYIDWISLIFYTIGTAYALFEFDHLEKDLQNYDNFKQQIGVFLLLYEVNSLSWIYLLARKEKNMQPDLYFALIPAPPHKKLNQLVRFGLVKIGITVLLANLIIAALLKTNPLYALFFTLYAVAIYLFKITVCFLLRIYVKSSPKSDSFTIIQGAVSLIAGMMLPGMITGLLIHGFDIITLVISLFGSLQGIPLPQIKMLLKYGITFFCYLTPYALFYAFFDKIYRKIDFGKN